MHSSCKQRLLFPGILLLLGFTLIQVLARSIPDISGSSIPDTLLRTRFAQTLLSHDRSHDWQSIWKRKGKTALAKREPLHWASGFNMMDLAQWRGLISTIFATDPGRLDRFKNGQSVVDFGCGAGAFLEALNVATGHEGLELFGVDYSPSLVDVARERVGKGRSGHFFVGDISRLGFFPTGEFDHAVSWSVLYYLNSHADALRAVAEMARVTKLGGSVVIADVSDKSRERIAAKLRGASKYYQRKGGTPSHLYFPKSFFRERAEELGLRIDAIVDEFNLVDKLPFYQPAKYRYTVFATKVG